jgi:hypothetical protein
VTKPVRLAATEEVRGSTSSDRGRPAAAFAAAVALLAIGGAAATFLIGGDQTRAEATAAPQASLAAVAHQLPVRTVKTITIKADPQRKTTKAQPKPAAAEPPANVAEEASAEAEILPREDPRWARAAKVPANPPIPLNAPIDLSAPATGLALSALAAAQEPSDPMNTAAIYRNEERVLGQAPRVISPELSIPEPQMPISQDRPAPTQTVRVNDGVNLRARGVSGSRVLRTIPANASVGLIGCKDWCEVVYEGTRGYIYKSFIGGGRAPAERVAASAPEQPVPAAADTATSAAVAPKTQPRPTPWRNQHENR